MASSVHVCVGHDVDLQHPTYMELRKASKYRPLVDMLTVLLA